MSSISRAAVALIGCCCLITLVAAKPAPRSTKIESQEVDPLMAMAQQHVHYYYQARPEYVYQREPVTEYQVQPVASTYEAQPQAESPQYRQPAETAYQYIQVTPEHHQHQHQSQPQPQHQHDVNCNHKHEYVTLANLEQPQQNQQQQASQQPRQQVDAAPHEYPGEIIYADPNVQASLSPQADEMGGVSLGQHSGLPATILAEIPIRDMPDDVLDKLKKDYGVKVVATRDRPGANLVINCDDYSNQDNSICLKQQSRPVPNQPEISYQSQPIHHTYEPTSEYQHDQGNREQQYPPAESYNGAPEPSSVNYPQNQDSKPTNYEQNEPNEAPAYYANAQANREEDNNNESNGPRSAPASEYTNGSTQPTGSDGQVEPNHSAEGTRPVEAEEHSGFGEQPKSEVEHKQPSYYN